MTRHDWADLPPSKWYDSGFWKRRRAHQLQTEPLCAECLRQNRVVPDVLADHLVPFGNSWESFRFGKLQSLCVECHDKSKRFSDRRGYRRDIGPDGWPTDPNHPVYTYSRKRP
jgi:5-methylcytosine-specific restriction endonuclease McrA